MKALLKKLRLNRIDLVDVPANPDATVMIVKRHEGDVMPDENVTQEQVTDTPPVVEPEAVEKAEDDTVAKRLVELEKAVANAEAKAAEYQKEIAKRDEAEEIRVFIEKAAKLGDGFGPAEEFGPLYRKIHKTLSAEEREKIDALFTSLGEVAKQSAVFKEVGATDESVDVSDDPWHQITKRAAQTYPDVDASVAITKFLATNDGRELYRKYTESKGV